MNYLVSDTQQAGDWLFRVISENGITAVLAVLFLLHVAFDILAFTKEWVVTGAASRRKDQQLEANNAILAAQEASRTEKIEKRLEDLEDAARDTKNSLEVVKETLRRIESRGGERNAG